MSNLANVRAEIKAWERDFATRHGRDPTVQDIRDQPAIADKYKLYKKLTKADSRLPAPKSRPADSANSLPGFNPFSPVKKSAKRDRITHPNPFVTPTKSRPHPRPRTPSPSPSPSPSPPPSIVLPPANASVSSSHGPTTAISRARKRLRGEPVSPSPNKPKRQRIRSQGPLPFPQLDQDSSSGEQEADQEFPQCDLTSSFVADSPVKAPAGGKSFKVLFDDALPALPIANAPDSVKPYYVLKSKGVTSGPEHRLSRTHAKLSTQIFPTKDHLPAPSHKSSFKSAFSQPDSSNKRALDRNDLAPSQPLYPLIPPSPPPQDLLARDTGKGKAKSTTGRKKLRVDRESDEGEDSPDDFPLKVVTVSLDRSKRRHADDEWGQLLYLRTRNHDSVAEDQIDANHHASGTFSVDLPDKFRRVLAISPPRTQNSAEERVVRGLLYGDRVAHYDPSRGGDIWDAGETDDGALGDAETENDWEGEPVPWEVGEL